MYKIGILGFGIIGHAVYGLFTKSGFPIFIYDPKSPQEKTKSFFSSDKTQAKKFIDNCDFCFVCVPTPHRNFDGLDMSAVEDCISFFNPKLFIVCSALQPGTADTLSKKYKKNIVVQPEYFGETVSHPLTNLSEQKFLILGGEKKDLDSVISLYQRVYNANIRIRKVSRLEAEIIKLSENRAIAYKVLQCQELYDACKFANVDYETIRQAVYGDDPRFNLWWTWVYENNRGLTSKCLPKDLYGWYKWMIDNDGEPILTKNLLEYNKIITRKNK